MTGGLFASLGNEQTPVADLFQNWRTLYHESHIEGTRHILQLCVDITGYSYAIKPEDVEMSGSDMLNFVQENVVKSNFQEVNVFNKPAVLERLFKLLEMMIVHDSQELLQNNFWLNRMIMMMVAFSEADDDECNMDVHELAEQKQKQLLEKYIALYRNHRSLPRITDTYHMVANFCFPTLFEPQLKRLMVVLYRTDPAQFCEVISQAAFQLLLFYKSESSVKNLFKKFQAFAGAELTEHADESASVVSRVVEKILNYMMAAVIGNAENAPGAKKMLKLIEPMLPAMPAEELVKMEHLLVRRQEYETLEPAERKVIDKFVRHLRKCADA